MLIVTELSEAVEAHRKNDFLNRYFIDNGNEYLKKYILNPIPNKKGFENTIKDTFEDEIADVFIRLFDLCGYIGIKELLYNSDHGIIFYKTIAGTLYNISCTLPNPEANSGIAKNCFNTFYSCMIDFSVFYKIDIENHIAAKMAYNKTREHKHGKRY